MNDVRIPQFCCATCANWRKSAENGVHGTCSMNAVSIGSAGCLAMPTLDLQLCTKWEKSDNAEEVMYGKRG